MIRKGLTVAVILLFIGLAVSPSIYAVESIEQQADNSIYSKDDKLISLPVREYKPDGTIRRYFVELTQSQYDEMNRRLQTAKDLDERLSIYKDYRVVPEEVTSESLRAGMEEKARRFRLDKKVDKMMCEKENLPSAVGSTDVYDNCFCSILIAFFWGIAPALGLSVITSHLNHLIVSMYFFIDSYFNILIRPIPNIDLLTLCIGYDGQIEATDGKYPDFELGGNIYETGFIGYVLMLGFVGYCIIGVQFVFRYCMFEGYTCFVRARGKV